MLRRAGRCFASLSVCALFTSLNSLGYSIYIWYWGFKWDPKKDFNRIDSLVAQVIGETGGYLYRPVLENLPRYPIPDFRLKNGNARWLLDLGCNWGRWTLSARKEGFVVVGVDPRLDAVLAAYRVAKQLGVKADFVVADARRTARVFPWSAHKPLPCRSIAGECGLGFSQD